MRNTYLKNKAAFSETNPGLSTSMGIRAETLSWVLDVINEELRLKN